MEYPKRTDAYLITAKRSDAVLSTLVVEDFSIAFFSLSGEHITEEELVDHLITLLTYANPDDQEADKDLVQELPQDIDAGYFAEELLGLST